MTKECQSAKAETSRRAEVRNPSPEAGPGAKLRKALARRFEVISGLYCHLPHFRIRHSTFVIASSFVICHPSLLLHEAPA
jgi:hypothetical protein